MLLLSTQAESERKLKKCKLTLHVAGVKTEIFIYDWSTVQELKQEIAKRIGVQVTHQRLFLGHIELMNSRMIDDYNIFQSSAKLKSLHLQFLNQSGSYVRACAGCLNDAHLLVDRVQQGLSVGISPCLTLEGTGGTYFLKTASKTLAAVFKPMDEEAFAPFNPKDHVGKLGSVGMRPGVLSGEAAYREVAAYLLDFKHFSSVPQTVLVEAKHPAFSYGTSPETPKTGSLQEYVKNAGSVEDYAPGVFSTFEVQKICVLDVRILNMDRNEGNILVVKNQEGLKLVPIDHGLSISDNFDISEYDLCWMAWPQAKDPVCPECFEYIESLDPISYIQYLQETMPFRDICLRNIRISSLLLKKGTKAGLSLYNIGSLLYRKGYSDSPSTIEKLLEEAYDLYRTITKSLSSRLKYEKFLSEPKLKCRPRAYSTNEIDFDSFIPNLGSLNSTETTSDSFYYTVVTISEVSENDDFSEDLEDCLIDLTSDGTQNIQNLSFSSSGLPSLDDSPKKSSEENDAFNTKLFYYIESFMDLAIQKTVKELLKSASPGGRTRSCSYVFNSN
jgi:hypothetical protein